MGMVAAILTVMSFQVLIESFFDALLFLPKKIIEAIFGFDFGE